MDGCKHTATALRMIHKDGVMIRLCPRCYLVIVGEHEAVIRVRDKRIATLEAENAELKERIEILNDNRKASARIENQTYNALGDACAKRDELSAEVSELVEGSDKEFGQCFEILCRIRCIFYDDPKASDGACAEGMPEMLEAVEQWMGDLKKNAVEMVRSRYRGLGSELKILSRNRSIIEVELHPDLVKENAELRAEVERLKKGSTLARVQEQQRPWVAHNFGKRPPWIPILGVMEELGELAHSFIKREQGIKGTAEEHTADIRDALADIAIFLCDAASGQGVDLDTAVSETWENVRKRDFKARPQDGGGHHHEGGTGNG